METIWMDDENDFIIIDISICSYYSIGKNNKIMDVYENFTGQELKIAEKIKQRRLQMLVHSYIYYKLDENIISDNTWATWAKELTQLQDDYPNIADTIEYADAFVDWDGSSGAFLPLDDLYVVNIAKRLLANHKVSNVTVQKPVVKKETKRALF